MRFFSSTEVVFQLAISEVSDSERFGCICAEIDGNHTGNSMGFLQSSGDLLSLHRNSISSRMQGNSGLEAKDDEQRISSVFLSISYFVVFVQIGCTRCTSLEENSLKRTPINSHQSCQNAVLPNCKSCS